MHSLVASDTSRQSMVWVLLYFDSETNDDADAIPVGCWLKVPVTWLSHSDWFSRLSVIGHENIPLSSSSQSPF